jgi:hypothetical protein
MSVARSALIVLDILPPPNANALRRGIPGLSPGRFSVHREKQPPLSLKGLPGPDGGRYSRAGR